MTSSPITKLPRRDQNLLRGIGFLVPTVDREEWIRSWQAELWCRRYSTNSPRSVVFFTDLSMGLCHDALWLRLSSWEALLRGTAVLCLLSLLACCSVATLLALALYGGWADLNARIGFQLARFLYAAPLVVFVNFATATRRPVERNGERAPWQELQRKAFFTAKLFLWLQFAYLLSLDLCAPMVASFPSTSDYLQMLLFVIVSLLGLRWVFRDQELRCKHCLRLLNEPMRVGRPSNNLLIWSGTELTCKAGHGMLTIPELETSWNNSSEWSTGIMG